MPAAIAEQRSDEKRLNAVSPVGLFLRETGGFGGDLSFHDGSVARGTRIIVGNQTIQY